MTADLIAKLEAAEGPSRELDAEIEKLIQMPPQTVAEYALKTARATWVTNPPAFTSSLDAALTLVPDDHDWIIYNVNGHLGSTPMARVGDVKAHAATPALALCIAALHARGEG